MSVDIVMTYCSDAMNKNSMRAATIRYCRRYTPLPRDEYKSDVIRYVIEGDVNMFIAILLELRARARRVVERERRAK